MKLRPLLLVAACACAVPAFADPRIVSHVYQPSEVIMVHGRSDTQSTIRFAPDERIENVAVGDSATWQVTPNKRADLLFVKPIKAGGRTNMTVITDQRTYLFDLVGASRHSAAVYMLQFTYPANPKRVLATSVPPNPVPVAPLPLAQPDPATLNFGWVGHGDKALLPSRTFDDGHSTWLAWPHDVALPAILVREAKGAEGPVNYTNHGDYIVIDGVPSQLVLRVGQQRATLTSAPRSTPAADPPLVERTAMNQQTPDLPNVVAQDRRP